MLGAVIRSDDRRDKIREITPTSEWLDAEEIARQNQLRSLAGRSAMRLGRSPRRAETLAGAHWLAISKTFCESGARYIAMTVNTAKASRRSLRFANYDELLREAERLASATHRSSTGNWSLAVALAHLTGAMRMSLDGTQLKAPLWLRLLGKVVKGRILRGPMSAGHQAPPEVQREFVPNDSISLADAHRQFVAVVDRLRRESVRYPHPVFGALSREQWDQLHLRHAELHLSFHDAA